MDQKRLTKALKEKASLLGFLNCGISQAGFLEDEAERLERWLNQGLQGSMSYLERHFDLRLDPRKLVDGAKSVISLQFNYFPKESPIEKNKLKISKYAYGQDYHKVLRAHLKKLLSWLQEVTPCHGRVFVDSAPILERAWAKKSGLGWIGKNTNLISKKVGSYFFLCQIITDLELEYDNPYPMDYCGSCRKCLDTCPTGALTPFSLNAQKCISYLTIELREELPKEFQSALQGWVFGCDICQDVCPWNRFSSPSEDSAWTPHPAILSYREKDWIELTEETFNTIFKKSPVKRAKYSGFKRNILANMAPPIPSEEVTDPSFDQKAQAPSSEVK